MTNGHSEGLRQVTAEADLSLMTDLRTYEIRRNEAERDDHIAYARSVRDAIVEGMPLDTVVDILLVEIPYHGFDVLFLIELLNLLLRESNLTLQFDHDCRVFEGDVEVVGSTAAGSLVEGAAHRTEQLVLESFDLAQKAGVRLVNGFPVKIIMPFVAAEIITNRMDNALVMHYLNEYLKEYGLSLQFDDYMNVIDVGVSL